MRHITALIAASLIAMPSAGIEVQGRVWTLSEEEAAQRAAEGDCHVVTGTALAQIQYQAFRMGMEHQAKQCGSRT